MKSFLEFLLTVTRGNFETVTDPGFIDNITGLGGETELFAEFTPVKENTDDWAITEQQRLDLGELVEIYRKQLSLICECAGR